MPVLWDIRQLDRVDSTQDTLKNIDNISEGLVIHALRQESGRGRHGRGWDAGEGNLTISFALEPKGDVRYFGLISLLCGLAVQSAAVDILDGAAELMLKWPNDALLDGRKIAGILIEREGDVLLCGIGVNIANAPSGIGVALGDYADVNVEAFRDAVLEHIGALYTLWSEGKYTDILNGWTAAAHPKGSAMSVKIGENIQRGTFKGLDEFGNLLLSQGENQVTTITAGDVYIGL